MAKKISVDAAQAFNDERNFKRSNTEVTVSITPDGSVKETRLFLSGNLIATKINGVVEVSNAGWFSVTTKDRLNALDEVSIHQSKGEWFLNEEKWNGNWTKIN
jgi:phage-related protein